GSYHMLAPLLVATTNLATYRELCTKEITTFSNTTDLYVADRTAKDCLILPSSGADLKAVSALADLAVTRGKASGRGYAWFRCCKALAEYRQQHFGQAIEWAASITKGDFPYAQAEAYAILSMAQNKFDATNAAQRALADCDQVIDKLPPPGTYVGQDWPDWIIAHALQSEAIQTAAERLPADQPNAIHLSEVLNWEAEARKYAE